MKIWVSLLSVFVFFVGCDSDDYGDIKSYNDYNIQKAIVWESDYVSDLVDRYGAYTNVGRVGWYLGDREYAYTEYLYEKKPEQVPISIVFIDNRNIAHTKIITGEQVVFIRFDSNYTMVLESPIDNPYSFNDMLSAVFARAGFDSDNSQKELRLTNLYDKSKDDFWEYIGKNLDEEIPSYRKDRCTTEAKSDAFRSLFSSEYEDLYTNIFKIFMRDDDFSLRLLEEDYEKKPMLFCGEPLPFGELLKYAWFDENYLRDTYGIDSHNRSDILFGLIALGNARAFKFLVDRGFEVNLEEKIEINDDISLSDNYAGQKYTLLEYAKLALKEAKKRNSLRKIDNTKAIIKTIHDIKKSR